MLLERFLPWLRRPAVGLATASAALIALTAGLAPLLGGAHLVNVALLFFLVVLLASAGWGYPIGLFTALLADLLLNFFFVLPLHTFAVAAPESFVALFLFLAVAVIGASMLSLLRHEVALSQSRATEANVLLELNDALTAAGSPREALESLCAVVAGALGADGCAILGGDPAWRVIASTGDEASSAPPSLEEQRMALAALRARSPVRGGEAENGRPRLFVPFPVHAPQRGALRVVGRRREVPAPPERLLAALAAEASASWARAELAVEAGQAEVFRRADALKALLLSSVSHDLRTPLTAIKAAVGNLRDAEVSWDEGDRSGFLQAIEEQTDRLTATVDDLLRMSRLEEGMVEPLIEPVQVSLLLRDAAQSARQFIDGRTIEIRSADELWVRADYGLLMRVLGNLIENAIRYSDAHGCIRLTADEQAGSVHITVHDDGPGIPPEDLSRVFEKFYRGSQSRHSTGTGLGLSIVKTITELCGGRVSVQSDAGGTAFDLVFPAMVGAP